MKERLINIKHRMIKSNVFMKNSGRTDLELEKKSKREGKLPKKEMSLWLIADFTSKITM